MRRRHRPDLLRKAFLTRASSRRRIETALLQDARSRAIPAADTRTVKVKSKTPENMKTTTPAIVKTDDRPLVSVKALSSSSKKLMPLSKIARPSTNCDAVFSEPAASPSCSTVRPKTSQVSIP
ncbi:unnamed protein product [Nippostrongylus brasiliensis]|uniref:Uncharacterized protein n=1 Tax=Nippostrongylus brasiliensis TaxID=27835 RepID=A0A0N4Y9T1_NIPBR|nr:unnamed protein product [Nippostrongylus brasiliensis]